MIGGMGGRGLFVSSLWENKKAPTLQFTKVYKTIYKTVWTTAYKVHPSPTHPMVVGGGGGAHGVGGWGMDL